MSLDLSIYPVVLPRGLDIIVADQRLNFIGDRRILEQIPACPDARGNAQPRPEIQSEPIPKNLEVWFFEEEGIDKTREDDYGEEIHWIRADKLRLLDLPEDTSSYNKAILSFVAALPEDFLLILRWH